MNDEEVKVFIAEIRKDIFYIKNKIDEKCLLYDRHLDESPSFRERITRLEGATTQMKALWVLVSAIALAIIVEWFKK
jgi:hypothetical protein